MRQNRESLSRRAREALKDWKRNDPSGRKFQNWERWGNEKDKRMAELVDQIPLTGGRRKENE